MEPSQPTPQTRRLGESGLSNSGQRDWRPLTIGIALGGGGNRGFAHIGVLKVLEAAGIQLDVVSGTSAGAAVGALYAGGYSALDIEQLSLPLQRDSMLTWVLPSMGFASGEPMERFINERLSGRSIEALPLRFGAVATDLQTGEPRIFQSGDVGSAVRASCAVPGLFQPVRMDERQYVDGGLVQPIPVSAAHLLGASFVIAVDVSSKPQHNGVDSMAHVVMQTYDIMGEALNRYERAKANVVIQPDIKDISYTDLDDKLKAIRKGEQAAQHMLPTLLAELDHAHEHLAALEKRSARRRLLPESIRRKLNHLGLGL